MTVQDEDEIEASRAPLLEHLVELRKRLVICVVALVIGVGFSLIFAGQLLTLLLHPYRTAAGLIAYQNLPGVSHNAFNPNLLLALLGFKDLPPVAIPEIQSMAPLEVFMAKLKIAAVAGVALTFPVIGYQLYSFVAPGLYKNERKAFMPFLFATPFLFVMGAALVYYVILPFVMFFSLNQQLLQSDVHVVLHLRLDDYLKIVTTLIFGFGLCFQLPVVLSLLGIAGIVDAKQLAGFRRYAIVGVTALAAFLTPPDPISMMSLAIPLMLLYEVSIWCVWLLGLRKKDEPV